jgi:CRISPR-associated endonuclease Csn1
MPADRTGQYRLRTRAAKYLLGLDVGTTSIGWAVIALNNDLPCGILHAGVRCFEAGVKKDMEKGQDASRAAERRAARLARRQLWRRAVRGRKLFRMLQALDLLPPGEAQTPQQRHAILHAIDQELRERYGLASDPVKAHLLPYLLRAWAVEQPLARYELGRALYHLAQRRGFQTNRVAAGEEDNDPNDQKKSGVVASSIDALQRELAGRTLGQFFATLDPRERRIRQRWTSRQMYQDEFARIWQRQAAALGLSEDDRKRLYEAIFYQRPLRSTRSLVGKCELEPKKRRAPLASLVAQEFRILQQVNHLRIRFPDHSERPLTDEERTTLIEALMDQSEISFAKARSKLKLTQRGTKFTIELEGEEKALLGNVTQARLAAVLGPRWHALAPHEKDALVLEVLHYQKEEALVRRAQQHWGLDETTAWALAKVRLERGYAAHSAVALEKLNALMRSGMAYATAKQTAYPHAHEPAQRVARLPPVKKALPELRNPAVLRALTELRKVVNAIIRRYGNPEEIHLELARDLRRSRKERKKISGQQRAREKQRRQAVERILAEFRGFRITPAAIEKVLLAEECNWECPFTGRRIHMQSLLGPRPQFDVAHIYPRRYLDDSFANKTLCYHEENRHRMGDRLPKEAYEGNPERWQEILARVKAFQGPYATEKLRRFQSDQVPADFVSRQLNDTRYSSKLAAKYLGLLYGGLWDAQGRRRLFAICGQATALLRRGWQLGIKEDLHAASPGKSRDDHRHHALDAIVVALTGPATIQKLSTLAARGLPGHERLLGGDLDEPWPGFRSDVRQALEKIYVSFRAEHKLAGPLHDETNYSPPIVLPDGTIEHRVRKALSKLTETEIREAIVDPRIRKLVQEKFAELGGKNPAKVFADPANHPCLMARDGRRIPIHKVRIRVKCKPVCIASDPARQRWVNPSGNHHAVIVAVLDQAGREIAWEDHVVTRLEAHQRLRQAGPGSRNPIIQRDWGPNKRFKFSLMVNDMLELDEPGGGRQLYRVRSLSEGDFELTLHFDARPKAEIAAKKQRVRMTAEKLRLRHARKVVVTPLGEIQPAGD